MSIQMNKLLVSPVCRPKEAAEYLSISRSYLYLLVKEGYLPMFKIGRRASAFFRADLDAWLDENKCRTEVTLKGLI